MADNLQETPLVEGRNWAPEQLGSVLVLGLGVTGTAVVDYCLPRLGERIESLSVLAPDDAGGFSLTCTTAGQRTDQGLASLDELSESYDLCVASPGIPQGSEMYQAAVAHAAEVVSEVEFAWRESRSSARWIGVTGTNGKTTTTALCAHLLVQGGLAASAVGNIGDTCIKAVDDDNVDIYVAELSSYQLASTSRFAPDVAVLLNITPDHLAWHGTYDAYVQAKLKMFDNLASREDAWAVFDTTNSEVRTFAKSVKAQGPNRGYGYIPVGTSVGVSGDMRARCGSENAAFVRSDGMLAIAFGGRERTLCKADELLIPGAHNACNALVAAAAALCVGAASEDVAAGLRTFASLPHRIEACGNVNGVLCYNDSKATNVDATLKALSAFEPARPVVMLGGDDKGTDLQELVDAAVQHCKAVVCYGASRDRFLEAFARSGIDVLSAEHLEDALDTALSHADDGDIVLLSPACASFDEFRSFEQRGDVFKQLVAKRATG